MSKYSNMSKEVKINKKRAVELCSRVLDAYHNRKGLFVNEKIHAKMIPESQLVDLIPKDSEKTRALWLFFSVMADRRVPSDVLYKEFAELYKKEPHFFDYDWITKPSAFSRLQDFLGEVKVAFPKQFTTHAMEAVETLKEKYDYNPLKVVNGAHHFNDAAKKLKEFRGFGTGLASLYLIFLQRYGIRDTFGLVPKIDTHIQQISTLCGVAEIKDGIRIDVLVRKLEKLYKETFHKHHFNALIVDPALWVIGKYVCSIEDRYECKQSCPLDEMCDKRKLYTGREHSTYSFVPSGRDNLVLNFGGKNAA